VGLTEAGAGTETPEKREADVPHPATILVAAFPVASALVLVRAFPPHDRGWVAWVGLIPFCLAATGRRWAFERYLGATIAGLLYYGLGLGFIAEFEQTLLGGGSGRFAKLWLVASVITAWSWPLALFLARRLHLGSGLPLTFAFPVAWTVAEQGRQWFCEVAIANECPLMHLGYSQVDCGPILQSAALGGMGLVHWLVGSVNAVLAVAVRSAWLRSRPGRGEIVGMGLTVLAFGGCLIYGLVRLADRPPCRTVSVALVPRPLTFGLGRPELDRLRRESGQGPTAGAKSAVPRLYLYGENAIDQLELPPSLQVAGSESSPLRIWNELLGDLARDIGSCLIVGTTRRVGDDRSSRFHRCAVLVDPAKGIVDWSDKSVLVPFAEFSPGWARWPLLARILPVTDLDAEISPSERLAALVIEQPGGSSPARLGAAICYDVTSPKVFRATSPGIDAFVQLGGEPADPRGCANAWLQAMSRCRAVENRRAIARCDVSGYACLIDPNGRVVAEFRPHPGSATIRVDLPLGNPSTAYQRAGDWPAYLSLAVVVIVVGPFRAGRWARRRRAEGGRVRIDLRARMS
jgi:apolipoprotein N-acyltransferase